MGGEFFRQQFCQESDELSANARIENRRKDQQLSELERLGNGPFPTKMAGIVGTCWYPLVN